MLSVFCRVRTRTHSGLLTIMRHHSFDISPPVHRGMMELDRTAFCRDIVVLAARVPAAKAGMLLRATHTKKAVLDIAKIKTVIPDPSDPANRLVLLSSADEAELTVEAREFMVAEGVQLTKHPIALDYDYWPADEIIHAILPEELVEGAPAGFAATGHVAHMNLNDEYLPYKHIIGQVILDKNKKIKTVVNKLDSIDTKFRFFQMELIAGVPDYIVEHHESDCAFTFDFTRVYWNSRLHHEHDRLVQMFAPTDVVADVFAGVGPFALPAAKKGCAVWANDLNPDSFKYLELNVEKNRVTDRVRSSCEDGREFIRTIPRKAFEEPFSAYEGPKPTRIQQRSDRKQRLDKKEGHVTPPNSTAASALPPRRTIAHFVMNLPDSAITFLDAFRGILVQDDLRAAYQDKLPMIHCHCFTRELEPERAEADIRTRVEEHLGHAVTEVSLHLVRSVAPNKEMYCISFRLPAQVAFS